MAMALEWTMTSNHESQEETFDEALSRLTEEFHREFGSSYTIPAQIEKALQSAAEDVLEISSLPILTRPYRCPKCGKFLELDYMPKDRAGFASANCKEHGWVGKHL